jgi:hypothetical protein
MTSCFPRRAGISTSISLAVVLVVSASSCQFFDAEPVEPQGLRSVQTSTLIATQKPRPDVMLMVDRSGSMNLQVDPACSGGSCPTRWGDLVGAMDGFLTEHGHVARMGLTPFAGQAPCVPGAVQVEVSGSNDVGVELQSNADAIKAAIHGMTPLGGTPTGATIHALSGYAPLANPDRDDFVVLLTDGLPNCNPDNPHDYSVDPAACRCTDPNPASCAAGGKVLCLDQDATVSQISVLDAKGVKTVVVGFGADTASGDAPAVLEAMGRAGGYTLTCPAGTDAECAGGTCDVATQTCSNSYYQATDGAALADALARLAQRLLPDPCQHVLPLEPSSAELLAVKVDDVSVASGSDTWRYVPPGGGSPPRVALVGALCAKAEESTTLDPMKLEIRILQAL